MSKLKVLNLYACLGGNRLEWDKVTEIEVTAVELDPVCAQLYSERFPQDTVIVADAHEYLLHHYKEFDFIWSSPPCPTHSRVRFTQHNQKSFKPIYPDLKLYEEIIFLENYFSGKYCVENVIPFYTPLIPGKVRGRHIYWTNFGLPGILSKRKKDFILSSANDELKLLCDYHKYDFYHYKKMGGQQRTLKMARNLVDYEAGKTIFSAAYDLYREESTKQLSLL